MGSKLAAWMADPTDLKWVVPMAATMADLTVASKANRYEYNVYGIYL